MTERFLGFIDFVLVHEGSAWEHDPDDPGNFVNGENRGTKYGIDARSHPKVDIRNLTKEAATAIYFDSYWEPGRCELLAFTLGESHFDACVNCGKGRATKFLQASRNNPVAYNSERKAFYRRLVQARPASAKYLNGWVNRVNDLNEFLHL